MGCCGLQQQPVRPCTVLEPLLRQLKSGGRTTFRIHIPGAVVVVVVNAGRRLFLERAGEDNQTPPATIPDNSQQFLTIPDSSWQYVQQLPVFPNHSRQSTVPGNPRRQHQNVCVWRWLTPTCGRATSACSQGIS